MTKHPELDVMARRVIDANHYMTLATVNPDGGPRVSPVYYTAARYTDLYWVSSPDAQHSRNIEERPEVEIVIFDSSAAVGEGEAVYLGAQAHQIAEDELDALIPEAFRSTGGARRFAAHELRHPAPLRLYVAHATRCEVHVAGRHPLNEGGIDVRMRADPA